jgi:predicted MFS family arabinose efflux permease
MYFFPTESAGLAVGIAVSGGGCGAFIMPILIEYLITHFGWEGSMLILGGIALNICICGALLRPQTPAIKTKPDKKKKLNFKILKNSNLTLFLLHQILFTAASSVVYIHITAVIETLTGVSRTKSSLALTVIGISNFIGRIVHGAIGDLKSVNVISQYLTSYTILGCALIIFPNVPFYPTLIVIGGIFGFLSAPYASLTQLIIVGYAGIENLKFVYGLFLFNCGIGLMIGAPIAGLLYDLTNDYGTSMYFGGASIIACVLLMLKPWVQGTCVPPKHMKEVEMDDVDNDTQDIKKHLFDEEKGFVT